MICANWRRVLIVAGIHTAVLFTLYVAWRPERLPEPKPLMKVGLVLTQPEDSAKPNDMRRSKPTPKKRSTPERTSPKMVPQKRRVQETKLKKWKPRSVDEIRRDMAAQPKRRTTTSSRTQEDYNEVSRRLTSELSQGTQATTLHGEPTALSDSYLSAIHSLIYRNWRQPSHSEVGRADPTVTIRLEIRKDGKITAARILHQSKNLTINQSVRLLLRNLKQAPTLPREMKRNHIRLDIALKLK